MKKDNLRKAVDRKNISVFANDRLSKRYCMSSSRDV